MIPTITKGTGHARSDRVPIAKELNITVLAEGIETEAEFLVLKASGIRLFQGYWFAKPAFEELPQVHSGPVLDITAVA